MVFYYILSVILFMMILYTIIKYEKSAEYSERFINDELENPCKDFITSEMQKEINGIVNMYKKK